MTPEVHYALTQFITSGAPVVFRDTDLSGINFSDISLHRAIITHCDLTDCVMPIDCVGANFGGCFGKSIDFSTNKSDLTDVSFNRCKSTNSDTLDGFNLVGAHWAGEILTAIPWMFVDVYWCMGTAVHMQAGCRLDTIEKASSFADDERRAIDPKNSELTIAWWHRNKDRIAALAADYIKRSSLS